MVFTSNRFLLAVAMIGFRNEETTVDERRPFSINVDLFNDIVPGRSVTVSVMEQSKSIR